MDKAVKHPVYAIVFLLFIILVVIPVLYTLFFAFFTGEPLSQKLASMDRDTWALLGGSILLAASVAFLSTLAGLILGFFLYRTALPFRGFFRLVLLIPLFLSPYILAVAWRDLFFVIFHDTALISSYGGAILVLTTVYTPLALLITGNALAGIHAGMEESGLLLTSPGRMVRRITFPLIRPAVFSSFILIFVFSISEFSVPSFLGIRVFTTEIFTQFSAFYNTSLAILQSFLLILVCILLLLAEGHYISDAPFFSVSSRGSRTMIFRGRRLVRTGLPVVAGWFFLTVVAPLLILSFQAFRGGTGRFFQAFSLLKSTFLHSVVLALAGGLLIVFTGLVAAWYRRGDPRMKRGRFFDWLLLLIFAIPSTVFGISLIKFYNHPGLGFIYAGSAIILIGYAGKFSFISARITGNALRQIPASLEEAALIAGVRPASRILKISIPLILPALAVSFLVGFIFSLGELGTTIMVYPPGTEIMPVKVFTIMANAPQALTSSMTLIVFLVTLLLVTAFYFLIKPLMIRYRYAGY